ncbi:MAG: NAD-glutamate dehydrogenase [Gammaproteobacteria bacterium]|nr:NAD-glutamate dehydrogenase [Gammaproteobacteria bacterium]
MPAKSQDQKNKKIDKLIAQARKKASAEERDLHEHFVEHYYSAVAVEDIASRQPAELCSAALAHLSFSWKRKASECAVRVYNPTRKTHGYTSTHTIVEMVNDDMPFLVDSASMALNQEGFSIHLTVHPIFKVQRNGKGEIEEVVAPHDNLIGTVQESFIRFEIDKVTDKQALKDLEDTLLSAMNDVRLSVEDWSEMRERASEIINLLSKTPPKLDPAEVGEGIKFLDWLVNNHFTFLGYREYDLVEEDGKDVLKAVRGSGLGILSDKRKDASQSHIVLPEDIRKTARARELLIITKANSVATVHRPSYLDYIGIKRFDADGNVVGERRFLGLFTSSAYSRSPRDIPLLRQKVEQVMLRSRLPFNSHAGKALLHILETFPRDELLQASTDELFRIATGVQQLQERQRVKVFIRRDSFGRYFSCLIYVPRDRYNTQIREKIMLLLKDRLNGHHVDSSAQISESVLARVHLIVRTTPWKFPSIDVASLEQDIEEIVRSWLDRLRDAVVDMYGEEHGLRLYGRFAEALPPAYREDVKPKAAAFDLERMSGLVNDDVLQMSLYRPQHNPKGLWRFKVFNREQPLPISDALPMLENMGLKVISERPYEVELDDGGIIWIQDFDIIYSDANGIQPEDVKDIFQETFARVWAGQAENDGFNKLVLSAQLTWRQVVLVRAYCKYLMQTGMPFSQAYMEQTLVRNAGLARELVELFELKFDPKANKQRDSQVKERIKAFRAGLEAVSSLDDDRILRAFLNALTATLRTNFYQQDADKNDKDYISFKFDPSRIPELPLPKPAFEIWVYSPRVEGVHLRGGSVARGGLRWSDRREDFRTEILGLMKAQQVKNTLIVPVGSKGGFVVKQPPSSPDREAQLAEGVECYKTFLRGMLDITDNIVDGKIKPPSQVCRHDEDDPYLVVAADKGTATFSDIANSLSEEYGFWLGDAFASGGSVGYDHKGMGITARGAWESVKRHFREIGINTQSTNFSVVGIGDMAGDVFGNGMLLSRHIKLKAAFNHMHIFLDPFPDPEASFKERERMFRLPRSSWEDYDTSVISKGGGVFSRSAKSIKLSEEVREALGIEETEMTPNELIRAILLAPVDLLWNGGIGTYVKARSETNADCGDRANDAVRVNGSELRCRVVGEGGNLGLTQLGRIEYALKGGRANTDFIDNAGGVDCSDHEVNIKILLNIAMTDAASKKKLSEKQRNKLLADMTDEVSELVLRDNYLQTQAISVAEAQAPTRITEHAWLMRILEREGRLNRQLEFLPNEEELADRRAATKGLTRPELSVLFSYAKMDIYDDLLESDVPEDSYLSRELEHYFPAPLRKRYPDLMPEHRLRREIIATAITNSMVHRMGPTFAHRMREESGSSMAEVAKAYTIAREVLGMRAIWSEIESLDNKIPANLQITMNVQCARLVKHVTHWLLDRPENAADIADAVDHYAPGVNELLGVLDDVMGPLEVNQLNEGIQQYIDLGVPEVLGRNIASLRPLYSALDIVDIADGVKLSITDIARAYFHIETRLELGWLREEIENLPVDGHWQAIARGTLRDNLYVQQRRLAGLALKGKRKAKDAEDIARQWLEERQQRVQHAHRVLSDMRTAGALDFATASVALQEIRKLG